MEFLIAFGLTVVIGSLIKIGKRQERKTKPTHPLVTEKTESEPDTEYKRKLQQADEELITVILPTINNDK